MTPDDPSKEKAFPHPLIATNLPGVYCVPAPPDDFDPNTASAAALIKHGIPWRRPQPGADPVFLAAWEKVFSRRWLSKDRIVPVLEPVPGRTHRPKGRLPDNSANVPGWAGCVLGGTPGTYNGGMAVWWVPTVSEPSQPQGNFPGWDSSSWFGIGGGPDANGTYYSTDVLQAGIQQYVDASGKPQYIPWYEWWVPPPPPDTLPPGTQTDANGYPLSWLAKHPYINQTTIKGFDVKPGDEIIASVVYHTNNTAGISLGNSRTGETVLLNLTPPPTATFNGSSVEWIMESPGGGWPTTSLPKFTPVTFGNAFASYPGCSVAAVPTADGITNIFTPAGQMTTTSVNGPSVTVTYIG